MRKPMTVLLTILFCLLCACGDTKPETPQPPPVPLLGEATLHTGDMTFTADFTFDGESADFTLTSPVPLAGVELRCGRTGGEMRTEDVTAPLPQQSGFAQLYAALLRLYGGGENALDGWTTDAEGVPTRLRLADGARVEVVCTPR